MSKTIELSIPHRLTQDEARTRLQKGIADLRREHGNKAVNVSETWQGNHMDFRFTAMAQTITGRVDVEANVVRLAVDLPWLLAALAGKIRPQIEVEGRKLLEGK